MSAAVEPVAPKKKPRRELSADVTFGKAYDARLVRRLSVYFKPYKGLFLLSALSYPLASARPCSPR